MNSMPLHPLLVHLPLSLAVLMPFLTAGFAWALWTGRIRQKAWLAVVVLQGLLLGSGLVAIRTGSAEEERVERVVSESALHRHEEMAEQFVWAGGVTLLLAGLVPVVRRRSFARPMTVAVVVAAAVVAGLGLRVGHAGGQLVYVHGAASVYTGGARTPAGDLVSPPRPHRDGRDRDDEGGRR